MAGSRTELEGRVEQSLQHAALWDEVKDRLHDSALAMSGGDYAIFLERPIALTLLAIGVAVLLLGLLPPLWRRHLRRGQPAE